MNMRSRGVLAHAGLFALIAASGLAQASSPEIQPGGTGNDTVRLQAALSGCSGAAKPCDIRLAAGTFYTDVLLAKDFNGSISGRGAGRTVIRPLAHRPLRSAPLPFIDEPTLAQPYPVLLHFANNSRVSISELTVDVPSSMRIMPYEVPYPGNSGSVITDTLVAAILVDGDRNAELSLTHVTVIGRDNDSYDGSNVSSAARFEGQIRYSGGVDRSRRMARGKLIAHDNNFQRTGYGIQSLDADHATEVLANNKMDVRIYGIVLQDLGASKSTVLANVIDAELSPVLVAETPGQSPAVPSEYSVEWNRLRVNETGLALDPTGGYAGIGVVQFSTQTETPLGETFKSNVTIFGNDIEIPANLVQAGIFIAGDGPSAVRVVGNRIHGSPYDTGIFVDGSRGTFIAGNDLRGIDAPNEDVHLTSTTRDCYVIERGDTVSNAGQNNHLIL
jgi:hypothetical protein